VIIILKQTDHQIFRRWNDHLLITMEISLTEALTGFTKKVRHLDGHTVTVLSTSIVEPGSKVV
jgi:DnaJ-class molecular chaperone